MSFICLTSVYDTIPGSWVGLTVILGSVQVLCKRVFIRKGQNKSRYP